MKLVHKDSEVEVQDGETVTDFRGDASIVVSREEPRHSGSTGRVYVKPADPADGAWTQGYYPSVFDLKWID